MSDISYEAGGPVPQGQVGSERYHSLRGLELSEAFFNACGLPMLERKYRGEMGRIAAGLVGAGSECFGCDDIFSRDHDWGPGFCLWLDSSNYERLGKDLQRDYDRLPKYFKGFSRVQSLWGRDRVGVFSINHFYSAFIGRSGAPRHAADWLMIPESNLAACTNGAVFRDPQGEFSAIRNELLAYYHEDVRLKKIAARLMSAAQAGQYNYLRCLRRHGAYEAQWSLLRFCSDALALVFLLKRRFIPFFKWRRVLAADLGTLGESVSRFVDQLTRYQSKAGNLQAIEAVSALIITELKRQGLSSVSGNFLLDHGNEVHSHIRDDLLRRLDVWFGG